MPAFAPQQHKPKSNLASSSLARTHPAKPVSDEVKFSPQTLAEPPHSPGATMRFREPTVEYDFSQVRKSSKSSPPLPDISPILSAPVGLLTKRFDADDSRQLAAPPSVQNVLRSPGQPLDPLTRNTMEQRFGHDFSRVRVHTDAAAQQSARDVNANAYTVGSVIVFGAQKFAPKNREGRALLAHELAHVVQNGPGAGSPRAVATGGDTAPLEREAIAAARHADGPGPVPPIRFRQSAQGLVARQVADLSRAEVEGTDAMKIGSQWAAKKDKFLAVASLPDNTLNGHQLFQIWFQYWVEKHNIAVDDVRRIKTKLWSGPDRVAYVNNLDLFENGKRDALGPEYQEAADRLDAMDFMLLGQARLLNWLEDWVNAAHHHLTFTQVNEKALKIAKGDQLFMEWYYPILLGAIGYAQMGAGGGRAPKMAPAGQSGKVEGPTTQPRSPSQPTEIEPVHAEPINTETVKPAAVKTDPVKPAAVKTDPVKPAAVKTDPVRPAAVKTDPAKPEAVTTNPVKPEAVKTDPFKPEPAKTQPSTGQRAEGGGRVVANRPVKPRTATAERYVWNNPRMAKGNFIEADLDADGALSVTVKSNGPDDLRVSGSKMLDDVFDHFGAGKILKFDAKWVRNSSFRDNFSEYVQNLRNGMEPEQAAWNTWTGRQLKTRGFTKVKVQSHGENPDIVSPVFEK